MADVSLTWNSDFRVDESGDLFVVDQNDELVERIARRVLTSSYVPVGSAVRSAFPDYIFDASYGGNLRLYVDALATQGILDELEQRLIEQISLETDAAPILDVKLLSNMIIINGSVIGSDNKPVLLPQLEVS